jgi:hypothetical protein
MQHFILTRFAVVMPYPYPSRLADPAWLTERFRLLQSFALPSVAAQSSPVTWLLGVDASVPVWAHERLNTIVARLSAFVVTTDGDRLGWAEAVREILRPHAGQPIITTRLDSDDAIARDFSARVREVSRPAVITFKNGAQLDRRSGTANHLVEPANPFLSLVSVDGQSILDAVPQHHILQGTFDLIVLKGRPAWLQVVHGGNLANFVFRGQKPISRRRVLEWFPVAPSAVPRETGRSFAGRSVSWAARRLVGPVRRAVVHRQGLRPR